MHLMASATRPYGGVSAEERRARRRAALIDAALDLFAASGAGAVTKRAVCARARLNDRYFYEHFADSDALLEALAQEFTAQALDTVVPAALESGPGVRAQVHAAVSAAIDFITADPRHASLLLSSHTSDVLQRARLASTHQVATVMAAMSRELLPDSVPSPEDTELAAFTLVSGTMELVAAWLRGEFSTSRDHLVDIITAMLLAATDLSANLPATASAESDYPVGGPI
jgi:AcrR family transcriptional regulator